jgi:hypothetical protein
MSKDVSMRDAAPVRWIGGARGLDEDSEIVRQAIVDRRVVRYGPLILDVADQLFARDHAQVGSVTDIGFFRSWYMAAARRLVARLEGHCVNVGTTPAGRQARA